MRRDPNTSQSLRERFTEEYKKLQQESDVVLSCAQQFSWAGGYGQIFGGAGMLQKLPFRAYVGLKKTDSGKLEYVGARAYSPIKQRFTELALGHFIDTHITDTLEEHILPLLPQEYDWSGYDVRLLLESDWIDVVPCFVALASALLLLSGSLTPDFFRQISGKHSTELATYEKQITLLWKVASLLENGYLYTPSITEVVGCLIEARLPMLMQTEDFLDHLTEDGRFVLQPEQLITAKSCGWFLYKYDEHFPRQQLMPLEWGVVSSGSHQMRSLHYPYTKGLPRFGAMQELESHMKAPGSPPHIPTHDAFWFRRKIELLHFYTMATVDTFGRSLVTYDAGPFLHALHAMHEISQLLQHHELDHVTAPGSGPFKEFMKKHLRGNHKYLITEKGMRGDAKIFFATPRHVLSGHMDTLAGLYPEAGSAAFEYASWLDGFGNDGVQIEYTRPFLLPSENGTEITGTLPPDILVDCGRHKLYLGGHRVTSNDLRSQHFTVEMLHLLHTAPRHRIPLSALPRLSYTDTANELQQKVLLPLARAVEKYTGRPLRLYCEHIDEQAWIAFDPASATLHFTHETSRGLGCHKTAATQPHLVAM